MDITTIAAISTPEGTGGIGIIRLSGPKSVAITEQLFRAYSGKKIAELEGYTGTLGEVIQGKERLDEAIVYRYKAPKSYTGEDIVEISCHGGHWVLQQILRLVLDYGAVAAEPGEFTKRAFLNGKMDLIQAESVMDLIHAQSKQALSTANNLKAGNVSTKIEAIVEKTLNEAAHLAAWADYPDEEMEMVNTIDLQAALLQIGDELQSLIASYDYGRILKYGIRTAIVGRPNVGKSTLMNLLSGYELSIVSEIPGTTRDIVKDHIRLGDVVLELSDTAGIRETSDMVEQIGVTRAKQQINEAELVLAVVDASQPIQQEDLLLLELLQDKQTILVYNKTDLPSANSVKQLPQKFTHVVEIAAKEGTGIKELEIAVQRIVEGYQPAEHLLVLTSERQRQALLRAKQAIDEARQVLISGITLDAVSVCLDEALEALLYLTGKKASEEVVNQVFAQFCVGK